MSGAIFGTINLDNRFINKNLAEEMMSKLSLYKLDDKKTLSIENACMGCGLIHITDEDSNEILPYYNKEIKFMITADAILDNREELIELLNVNDEKITDSQLILKSYLKWKYDCVKHLLGDYAFIIYDMENNEIFSATDYTGCRTLYYKFINNTFSFSTVIKPIYENEAVNERWLADFISLPVVMHHSESEETIYKGIYQIPAATYMVVNSEGLKKIKYWDPVKDSKKIHFNSDEEYVKEFQKIFTEAVRCRLRTNENIGISMSGGLDSSSVGCIAAPILKNQNKKLISFTSVPDKSYVADGSYKGRITDETHYVELISKMYENIEINYCRSEGRDSLSDMDKIIEILEQPYKTFQNTFWCTEVMKRITDKKCRVMLTGQFGNFTISYGDFFTNMKTLIKDKKYLKFLKEVKGCSRLHNISNIYTLKYVFKNIFPYMYSKLRNNKELLNSSFFDESPINDEMSSKWNIKKRFEENCIIDRQLKCKNMYEERSFMTSPFMFTQIGTIETKLSLFNGIIGRDPTKDKRVIEFCFGLDGDQYVRNGLDRYLIRRAMKDKIPEEIRMLQGNKGLQGADWLKRLMPKQEYICSMLNKSIEDENCKKYFNIDKIKEQLNILSSNSIDNKGIDVRTILMSINLYIYFNKGGTSYEEMGRTTSY